MMIRLRKSPMIVGAVALAAWSATASAQTSGQAPRFEVSAGAMGGLYSGPAATIGLRARLWNSGGLNGTLALRSSGFAFYTVGVHQMVGTSAKVTPYLEFALAGAIDTHSSAGSREVMPATGDTLVHPAFHYTKISGPEVAIAGGGVRFALTRHLAAYVGAHCWFNVEAAAFVGTAGIAVSWGKGK